LRIIYWMPLTYGEAFFHENGDVIYAWHENDDHRTEYLDSLLNSLGLEIKQVPSSQIKSFTKKVKRRFSGIADD